MLVVIVATGFALWLFTPLGELLDKETLLTQLDAMRESSWAYPTMVGLVALFSFIGAPITPLILANGAVFGVAGGIVANLVGTLFAGITGFYIARLLGQELFFHLLKRTGLERIEHTLERHGFWTLVRIRFLPIPYGLVNYASGLTPMPIGRFLGATALPLLPVLSIYSYLGHALVGVAAEEKSNLLWGAGAALVALFLLSWIPGRSLRREVETDVDPESET